MAYVMVPSPEADPLEGFVTVSQLVVFDAALQVQPEGNVVTDMVPVPAAKSGAADGEPRVTLHAKGQSTVENWREVGTAMPFAQA